MVARDLKQFSSKDRDLMDPRLESSVAAQDHG